MMIVVSSILAIVMAIIVMAVRIKSSEKPATAKKIILPPIFMSTGALMFLFPVFHVTGAEFLEALTVGMIFSIFLIKTSKFEIRDDKIYIKRSKSFVFILIAVARHPDRDEEHIKHNDRLRRTERNVLDSGFRDDRSLAGCHVFIV